MTWLRSLNSIPNAVHGIFIYPTSDCECGFICTYRNVEFIHHDVCETNKITSARSLSRYFSLVTIERGFSALLCSGDFCYLLCTITILCHIAREC